MSFDSECERLFIAAFANDEGVSVLANRIREQLGRVPDIRSSVAFSVFQTMLGAVPMRQNTGTEEMLESMPMPEGGGAVYVNSNWVGRQRFFEMRDEVDREMERKFTEWDASHKREPLVELRGLLNRRNSEIHLWQGQI